MARKGYGFAYDRRGVSRRVNDPLNDDRETLVAMSSVEAGATAIA